MSPEELKIYINFAYKNISYGGGNQFVSNLVNHITSNIKNYKITYELEDDINIFLLINLKKQ